MTILIAILTLLLVVAQDYSTHKDPFDNDSSKGEFNWKLHWWKPRHDNVIGMLISGLIGAALSSELAIPLMKDYLTWPSLAEHAAELTGMFVVTFAFAKYLKSILGFKKG